LPPETLNDLIVRIVDAWADNKNAFFEVLVSPGDKLKLEQLLFSRFKGDAAKTVTIKATDTVTKGFRISVKGTMRIMTLAMRACLKHSGS